VDKVHVMLLLVAGLGLLAASVYLRGRYGERFEIRTVDLVLIIVPLLFTAVALGKVTMFDAFGVKADLSKVFSEAAGQTIADQVSNKQSQDVAVLVQSHQLETKGGVREIPQLIEKKTDALLFRLEHGGYYGPAIQQYLDQLVASSYLKYVVINEKDGTLFGIYTAKELSLYFLSKHDSVYALFAKWLNRASDNDRKNLSELPGFVGAAQAISPTVSKSAALAKLDKVQVDTLPVIDDNRRFSGTVSRSQLTASLILDVVNRLEGHKAQ